MFLTSATNLFPGGTSPGDHVYLHDRITGQTEWINREFWNYPICIFPSISADGRFVTYSVNDTAMLHDRTTGTNELVAVNSMGVPANDLSFPGNVSADGRFVGFKSMASNLAPVNPNASEHSFIRDRMTGITEHINISQTGEPANSYSSMPYVSDDGRFVAYTSYATNLVPGDTNETYDVFLRDRFLGTTTRISIAYNGDQANGHIYMDAMSSDGRYIVLESDASNLVPGDTNGQSDVFLYDHVLGTIERVSLTAGGGQSGSASQISTGGHCVSNNGRYVVFVGTGDDLVSGDTNGVSDIFVRDRVAGITQRVSLGLNGEQPNGHCDTPSISADGHYVLFGSEATNLVPNDTNGVRDIFVRGPINVPEFATISGKIAFSDLTPTAFPVTVTLDFRVTDGSGQYVRTLSIEQSGDFVITDVPCREYQLHLSAPRHLATNVPVQATEGSADDVAATLLSGDANADNSIDVLDLDLLIQAFDAIPGDPNWNPNADFNGNNSVDILDLDILIRNFDLMGDV